MGRRNVPSSGWRWANALMALFFAYATYVQQNDPDSGFWMGFYGFSATSCLVAIFDKSIAKKMFIICASLAISLLVQRRIETGELEMNPKSELGREASGTAIVLVWALQNILLSSLSSSLMAYAVIGVAFSIATSAYIIPKLYLSPNDTIEHCVGLGFSTGKN